MNLSWDNVFDRLIGHEGEYSNDPNDPGGETKWGISKRAYPHLDIKNLTREAAKDIYYRDFWLAIDAEDLPDGVAFQLFDFAINSGIGTAIRHFQRALGVADDGNWGPISQGMASRTSESDMIMRLNAERLDFMTRLKNWPNHGKGWARRIAQNLRYGAIDS
jgi:lysozyme family protein